MSRRLGRWLIGVLVAVLLAAVCLWVGYSAILPRIVRAQVAAALGDLGFKHVTFDLTSATLWATDVANVRQREGQPLEIGGIAVRYSPLEAVRGKLDSILLTGARIEIDLDNLPTAKPSTGQGKRSFELPFDRLDLHSCVLVLTRRARRLELPVQGALVRQSDGAAQLKLKSLVSQAPLEVSGAIDPATGSIDISAEASEVSVPVVLDLLPASARAELESSGGTLSVSARFVRSHGAESISVQMSVDRLSVQGQELSDASLALQLQGRSRIDVSHFSVKWAGGNVQVDPMTIDFANPLVQTTIIMSGVRLNDVLLAVSDGKASGTGTVSGAVPLEVSWNPASPSDATEFSVRFGEGVIHAESGGNLRFADPQKLADLLERSNSPLATDPELRPLRDDILSALVNFDYRLLEARFHKMDGEQNIAIRIEGRGNTGSRLPINLSFNVLDLDAWLRNYLGTWKRVLSEMTGKADG